MTAQTRRNAESEGFEGAVAGLTLSDVIQLSGMNRFSGCLNVAYAREQGFIFFRDGDIIHAERGKETGEEAFYAIMRWPGGKFQVQPKVTTTSHTIRQGTNFLLLEAHRLMDEQKAANSMGNAPTETKAAGRGGIVERIGTIPGIDYAVTFGKDGVPDGDNGLEAEVLAAQGFFLAMAANGIGAALGLGEARSAALHGENRHLLLFESKERFLAVAVDGEHSPAAVESEIRALFVRK